MKRPKMMVALVTAWGILFVLQQACFGSTLLVPAHFETIQAAVDAAVDEDIIQLADGVYTGDGNRNVLIENKTLTIASAGNAENCIIDCQRSGRAFFIKGGEQVLLRGITITNGLGDCGPFEDWHTVSCAGGGAILCDSAHLQLEDCIISENRIEDMAPSYGGGIRAIDSTLTIWASAFDRNLAKGFAQGATGRGGGISSENTVLVIENSLFTWNEVGGSSLHGVSGPGLGGTIFLGSASKATIRYCTIVEKSRFTSPVYVGEGSNATIGSTIISLETLFPNVPAIDLLDSSAGVDVTFSNIRGGYPGEGNIAIDPRFVEPKGDDYRLNPGSPCIDSASESGDPLERDIAGNPRPANDGYDMGAYEFQGTPDQLPVIEAFTGSPQEGVSPLSVAFSCRATDPEGGSLMYIIDYGDGSPVETNGTGNFTHTYNIGNYGVRLVTCKVTDAAQNQVVSEPIKIDMGPIRVPTHFPDIQSALDAATDGDTVLVADGSYTSTSITIPPLSITLTSENGPTSCQLINTGIEFSSLTSPLRESRVLDGFTITGAADAGIRAGSHAPMIRNCIILGSGTDGVLISSRGAPTLINCVIAVNGESGISCAGMSTPMITNCTIADNGSFGVEGYHRDHIQVINSILWNNGDGPSEAGVYGQVDAGYSIVQGGYPGEANLDADPLFVNRGGNDYRLMETSPALDAADETHAPETDILGRTRYFSPDIGAYEFTSEASGDDDGGDEQAGGGSHSGCFLNTLF